MSKRLMTALAGMALGAGGASAQNIGDILWIDANTNDIEQFSGGVRSTLFDFNPGPTDQLLSMSWGPTGVGGDIWITNGQRSDQIEAEVLRLADPFGAQTVSTLASGAPLRGLVDLDWDAARNQFVTVVNPTSPSLPGAEGLASVGLDGSSNLFFQEPTGSTTPRFLAGAETIVDSITGDYIVSADGAGVGSDGSSTPNAAASTLFRIDNSGNASLMFDFTDALVGLGSTANELTLSRVRGLTQLPDGSLVVSNVEGDGAGPFEGGLYRLTLDGSGDVTGIDIIAENLGGPREVIYDPTTESLVLHERDFVDPTTGDVVGAVSRINLDGTGYEVLATDVFAREFLIVPSPSGLALLGMGGLLAARRRR